MEKKYYSTDEVIEIVHKHRTYCCRWAKKNNVERELIGSIWAYKWTKEDIEALGVKGCRTTKKR